MYIKKRRKKEREDSREELDAENDCRRAQDAESRARYFL